MHFPIRWRKFPFSNRNLFAFFFLLVVSHTSIAQTSCEASYQFFQENDGSYTLEVSTGSCGPVEALSFSFSPTETLADSQSVSLITYPDWFDPDQQTTGSVSFDFSHNRIDISLTRSAGESLSGSGRVCIVKGIGTVIDDIHLREKRSQSQVGPNPCTDFLSLYGKGRALQEVTCWDLTGKQWMGQQLPPKTQFFKWDLSALPAGTYAIKVRGEGFVDIHLIYVQ